MTMGAKPGARAVVTPRPQPDGSSVGDAAAARASRRGGSSLLWKVAAVLALVVLCVAAYVAIDEYRVHRLARTVRHLFRERRYEEARIPLSRWLAARPGSGEASYYKAWAAIIAEDPAETDTAIDQARRLGFDASLLDCLAAVHQSRLKRVNLAEPVLQRAFREGTEPRAEIAQELARIYLSTYRLAQAAQAIERWRTLAPDDPQPYLWANEIASRSDAEPSVLLHNYRAALERDPKSAKAQLGLAHELSKARRFDEADEAFRAYLQGHPQDATALVQLGRNAFQRGDLEGSRRYFESAVAVDPRQADALKELAQSDIRLYRLEDARKHLELLTQIDPYDFETRYSFAQVLRRLGDLARFRVENEQATQLRKDNEELMRLRHTLLANPGDAATRFRVAKWMLEHGHEAEGLKWTTEILRTLPRHAPTHGLLADYYNKRGDSGLANYHRLMASTGEAVEKPAEARPQTP